MSNKKTLADIIVGLHPAPVESDTTPAADHTALVVEVLHAQNVSYQAGIAAIVDHINIDRPDDDTYADEWTRGHHAASRDIRRRLLELDAPQRALGRISTSARELDDLREKSVVMNASHDVYICQSHGIFVSTRDAELVDGEAILASSEKRDGVAFAYVLFESEARS